MRRSGGIAWAALLALVLAGCATINPEWPRAVSGRVTDEAGRPVPNNPVVVVARTATFDPMRFAYNTAGRQEARATTDADGRYRIDFAPANLGNNFFLFFYDRVGFDRVKYKRPLPQDITEMVERERAPMVNQVLEFTVTWPEVQRQIAFYGAETDRGRILRTHGLPEKREQPAGAPDQAVWWYSGDGVSYRFSGNTLTNTTRFTPGTQGALSR
jgi:hypothetical protein